MTTTKRPVPDSIEFMRLEDAVAGLDKTVLEYVYDILVDHAGVGVEEEADLLLYSAQRLATVLQQCLCEEVLHYNLVMRSFIYTDLSNVITQLLALEDSVYIDISRKD